MRWRIEVITLHRVRVPGPEVFFQRSFEETIDLAIHAFLLRDEAGATCLIDTGLAAEHAALDADIRARKGPQSGFRDVGAGLASRLDQAGVRPDTVVLTSFGPYAIGGLGLFPEATTYISTRGWRDLVRPEEPALVHRVDSALRRRIETAQRIETQAQILPGITAIEVGIHHPASMAVIVETAEGRMAIADPVFTARNLREGIALGVSEHAAGWHGMVRELGRQCDAMLPIHDPDPAPVARAAWHQVFGAESADRER